MLCRLAPPTPLVGVTPYTLEPEHLYMLPNPYDKSYSLGCCPAATAICACTAFGHVHGCDRQPRHPHPYLEQGVGQQRQRSGSAACSPCKCACVRALDPQRRPRSFQYRICTHMRICLRGHFRSERVQLSVSRVSYLPVNGILLATAHSMCHFSHAPCDLRHPGLACGSISFSLILTVVSLLP
jgi:hypothetical protein